MANFANMPSGEITQKFYDTARYLTAFSICLPFSFAPFAIAILCLAWLANLNIKTTITYMKQRKLLWLWFLFYAIHLYSSTYSVNTAQSHFDLETKLSFIILPIIIGPALLDKNKIKNILLSFIAGLAAMAVLFLSRATWNFAHTHDMGVFFYHTLVGGFDANAVYYSLYSFLAIAAMLFMPQDDTYTKNKFLDYSIFFIVLIFFILLSSKSMLLLFCVLVLPMYLKRSFHRARAISFVSITLFIVAFSVIAFTKNPIKKRYTEILVNTHKTEWLPEYSTGKQQHFNNLTLRLFLWKTALENVQEQNLWLTGCGNGGVQEIQKQKILTKYGTKHELLNVTPPLWEYNLHNMYIQTLLMLGLPGLFTFILIVISPFLLLKNVQFKPIISCFTISTLFFMVQESALQTQAGIIFFTFFSVTFTSYLYSCKTNTPADEKRP